MTNREKKRIATKQNETKIYPKLTTKFDFIFFFKVFNQSLSTSITTKTMISCLNESFLSEQDKLFVFKYLSKFTNN
jgi:hypothetical protein